MVRYAAIPNNPSKSAKSCGSFLRVSFKNTRETSQATTTHMKLSRAIAYLENVKDHREAVPMRRYARSAGRCAQGKQFGVSRTRWPEKSAEFLLGLLRNAEANADTKGLDNSNLIISHFQVNQAPKQRRRTYRAHGRIKPYMSDPCDIEVIVSETEEAVVKTPENKIIEVSTKQRGRSLAEQRPIAA
ncbi:ribosomal protein L22 [Choiromyces venosus 120613-1]|uniref:Ribosomal protein L22 n=1 Tax=Choiromyces venosus 120613-1 TaxID=1336337 RepID=A0A3N4JCX9_9PEZI|nr:ribosomal protein L22 [Choiromyces venosus 120613-1]